MPKQPAIPELRDAMKKKVTRREQLLAKTDPLVPLAHLQSLIEPHHPKIGAKCGRCCSRCSRSATYFLRVEGCLHEDGSARNCHIR